MTRFNAEPFLAAYKALCEQYGCRLIAPYHELELMDFDGKPQTVEMPSRFDDDPPPPPPRPRAVYVGPEHEMPESLRRQLEAGE